MSAIRKLNQELNELILENINNVIKEKGFSIREIAKHLGIDYSMAWRILHGKRRLKPEHIAEIAYLTHRTPNDFFYAKD